jgi:DNA replication protein DnaC
MITSNLVFSQWDKIFKDPMTTAAAIDRVVHHATILEINGSSYRNDVASKLIKEKV